MPFCFCTNEWWASFVSCFDVQFVRNVVLGVRRVVLLGVNFSGLINLNATSTQVYHSSNVNLQLSNSKVDKSWSDHLTSCGILCIPLPFVSRRLAAGITRAKSWVSSRRVAVLRPRPWLGGFLRTLVPTIIQPSPTAARQTAKRKWPVDANWVICYDLFVYE